MERGMGRGNTHDKLGRANTVNLQEMLERPAAAVANGHHALAVAPRGPRWPRERPGYGLGHRGQGGR